MHILHCWHTPSHGADVELPYTVMQPPAMSTLLHNKFSHTISLHSLPTLPAWRSPGSKLASQAAIYPHLPIYFILDIGSMIKRIHNKGTSGFRRTHYSCAWRRRDLAIATLKYAERTENAPITNDSTQWNMTLMSPTWRKNWWSWTMWEHQGQNTLPTPSRAPSTALHARICY